MSLTKGACTYRLNVCLASCVVCMQACECCMRARVCFSVACMGTYACVFVSACVRVSVARQHAFCGVVGTSFLVVVGQHEDSWVGSILRHI